MREVLASPTAFKSKYVKNPIISKAITSAILGIGASSAIVGVAASSAGSVAATTGLAGVVGHFTALPIIGGAASSFVSGAAATAAVAAAVSFLPISLAVGGAITGTTAIMIRKKTAPYQKGTRLEKLAEVVSKIIFLPLLSKYKKIIEDDSSLRQQAIEAAVSRITDFGYKKEYADFLVRNQFEYSSSYLSNRFDEILGTLNGLKKNELYEGIPKYELPPKGIQKLAFEIANT